MTIERPVRARDEVVMDDCHIELIRALVRSAKPKKILELGIGSGAVTIAILDAVKHNQNDAALTCVDNFFDWGGVPPHGLALIHAKVASENEGNFIASCVDKFDFIVSDADHEHSHEWADKTLLLLNRGGIAVFHDVSNPDYPNLSRVIATAESMCFQTMLFNTSSRPDERCHRGLLVVSNL